MREENLAFYSDGLKLDGSFYHPDSEAKADTPVVIVCSGFTGLKDIHPERYARFLTKHGYICFGFDYRGFAKSEGERGMVLLEEQERDIANAVAFVRSHASGKNRPIVLAGWGMAGGLIINAARLTKGVDALIAMNGFYNSKRVQRAVRGDAGYAEYLEWMDTERTRLANGGEAKGIDPFDIYPLDAVSKGYVDGVLRKNPNYGMTADFRFADSLLDFNPEGNVKEFTHTPLFIAHGADNALHPITEPKALKAAYPGPCEMFLLEGGGHTEWMLDENPLFQKFAGEIKNWLDKRPYDRNRAAA
ncbi:MAG: alpha/beta hydrolase [Alphaproteobacteria bacterium]|nr:alpha/beta hydrolase [Alphaproteobacteria bacterium]